MNNKRLNSKYYGSSLSPILSDIFRYFVIMIAEIIVYIICKIIWLVTYEKGKRNGSYNKKSLENKSFDKVQTMVLSEF